MTHDTSRSGARSPSSSSRQATVHDDCDNAAGRREGAVPRSVSYQSFDLSTLLDDVVEVQSKANEFTSAEEERRRRLIAMRAQEPLLPAVGAFVEERLVGFCYGAPFDAQWPWAAGLQGALEKTEFAGLGIPLVVLELHVHPNWWRQGIGSSLIQHICRGSSARWVLLTRKRSSARAGLFYKARGFTELPIRMGPFVVMAARLPDGKAKAQPAFTGVDQANALAAYVRRAPQGAARP